METKDQSNLQSSLSLESREIDVESGDTTTTRRRQKSNDVTQNRLSAVRKMTGTGNVAYCSTVCCYFNVCFFLLCLVSTCILCSYLSAPCGPPSLLLGPLYSFEQGPEQRKKQ